jgi:RhtB (resistance to homoserine/threonine) family protein
VGIHLWAFAGISALIIVVPGPDTALVTKNAVLHGRNGALGTSLGVNAGLLIWTVAAAFGVAAVVRESAVAFMLLKLVGALYLIWLGLQSLRAAARRSHREDADDPKTRRGGARSGFRQGLCCDLANPKIGVFFTALLPQFVSPHEPVLVPFLLLGGVFVLMGLVWLCGYALLAARLSQVLTRPTIKTALDRVTGVALVGLGIRLGLEHR